MSKNPDTIQIRITVSRKDAWKSWKEQSRYEINSKTIWEAVEVALRFKEIQKSAKIKAEIDPKLLGD